MGGLRRLGKGGVAGGTNRLGSSLSRLSFHDDLVVGRHSFNELHGGVFFANLFDLGEDISAVCL
jgi:hypothetical protein